jgi:hypothetical protein
VSLPEPLAYEKYERPYTIGTSWENGYEGEHYLVWRQVETETLEDWTLSVCKIAYEVLDWPYMEYQGSSKFVPKNWDVMF